MPFKSGLTQLSTSKSLFIDVSLPTNSNSNPPTLLLLHGLGSSHTFYSAVLSLSKRLTETYRVVRYDFDGHGQSPVSNSGSGENPLTITALAEDAKAVLDAVGVDKAVVVGHSMSGLVAATLASLYPSAVTSLFLIGPVKALPPASQTLMLERASTVRSAQSLLPLIPAILSSALSPHTLQHSPLSAALLRCLLLSTPVEGYARACEALAGAENPQWEKVDGKKVAIVGGETDYLCTKVVVDQWKELLGGSDKEKEKVETVEMKDVGHWHAIEDPEGLSRLLENWVLEGKL